MNLFELRLIIYYFNSSYTFAPSFKKTKTCQEVKLQ